MERHEPSGQFYNWYDHRDGSKLTKWPPTGADLDPILSLVDNGWLATGLRIVERSIPSLSARAGALYDSMDFGFYYVPESNRILFHYSPVQGAKDRAVTTPSSPRAGSPTTSARPRASSRPKAYYGRWRTFPDSCQYSFQEARPSGFNRTYEGVTVYEGSYPYKATRITPSWGGSMFEALMPDLFVPEERWAAGSWRMNHPFTVDAQIDHGLNVRGVRHVGVLAAPTSPKAATRATASTPPAWTRTACCPNEDGTLVDRGFAGCPNRPAKPDPPASAYTNGVVDAPRLVPRAALPAAPRCSRTSRGSSAIPGAYNQWGFADSVNVGAGFPSPARLSLDQGMIMAALGNALGGDVLRDAFSGGELARDVRPVLGDEEFNVQPRGCTITGTAGDDRLVGTAGDDVICGSAARIWSWPAAATTCCSATPATTCSRPGRATTRPTAATASTGWRAKTATTCSRAARASDRLEGGAGTDHSEQGG